MMMSAMAGLISGRRAYDANTLLMCHFDGANESTTITDAVGRHTLTAVGDAKISTAQAKFGQSLLLDGNGDYVTAPDSSDWDLTANYTIECWARGANMSTAGFLGYGGGDASWSDTGGGNSWNFLLLSNTVYFQYHRAGNTFTTISTAVSPAANTWEHWAVVINSNVINIYKNGTSLASGTLSNYAKTTGGTQLLSIGIAADRTSAPLNGHIDELRISNVARWTANFTVPLAAYK